MLTKILKVVPLFFILSDDFLQKFCFINGIVDEVNKTLAFIIQAVLRKDQCFNIEFSAGRDVVKLAV